MKVALLSDCYLPRLGGVDGMLDRARALAGPGWQ